MDDQGRLAGHRVEPQPRQLVGAGLCGPGDRVAGDAPQARLGGEVVGRQVAQPAADLRGTLVQIRRHLDLGRGIEQGQAGLDIARVECAV